MDFIDSKMVELKDMFKSLHVSIEEMKTRRNKQKLDEENDHYQETIVHQDR